MPEPPDLRVRRIYEPAPEDEPTRATRVLVDRLWPRGIRKEGSGIDVWRREVAPSDELRAWFGHDPARWDKFRRRYRAELESPERQAAVQSLLDLARRGPLVLLYGARDVEHNQAIALRDILLERLQPLVP